MFNRLQTFKINTLEKKYLSHGLVILVSLLIFFYKNYSSAVAISKDNTPTKKQISASAPALLPAPTTPPKLKSTDFLTNLKNPWDLAFTPDDHMFFTEKCRGLSVRKPDGSINRLFGTTGSALVAIDFFCLGQSGMNGVAVDPDFKTNRYVYVYMASNINSNPRTNRVVRLVVNSTYSSVDKRVDIVTDIPFKHVANSWGGAGSHSGGRIRFGADDFLYVTTGDNHNGAMPQDLQRLGGKILRVDRNGAAAAGNKTPKGGDSRILTYGHRNVQGLTFRTRTNQVFIAEHGPGHTDEVNLLVPGGNFGWDPAPDSSVSCADNYCGYISNKIDGTLTSMTDLKKFPKAIRPIWTNAGMSQGTGPLTFVNGAKWKAWDGRLLVGIMRAQRLAVLQLNTDGTLISASDAAITEARYRSLVQGPDGNLYIVTDGGEIWRVTPE